MRFAPRRPLAGLCTAACLKAGSEVFAGDGRFALPHLQVEERGEGGGPEGCEISATISSLAGNTFPLQRSGAWLKLFK